MGEAAKILDDGTPIEVVDRAFAGLAPMPPFVLIGLVGPAIALHNGETLVTAFPDRFYASPTLQRIVAAGKRGFYDLSSGRPVLDPEVAELIEKPADPVVLDLAQVRERVLTVLADEARRMLDEGVAQAPMDIDLAMITGAGFQFWNGGITPLLDRTGVAEAVTGARFLPVGVANARRMTASRGCTCRCGARPSAGSRKQVGHEPRSMKAVNWLRRPPGIGARAGRRTWCRAGARRGPLPGDVVAQVAPVDEVASVVVHPGHAFALDLRVAPRRSPRRRPAAALDEAVDGVGDGADLGSEPGPVAEDGAAPSEARRDPTSLRRSAWVGFGTRQRALPDALEQTGLRAEPLVHALRGHPGVGGDAGHGRRGVPLGEEAAACPRDDEHRWRDARRRGHGEPDAS